MSTNWTRLKWIDKFGSIQSSSVRRHALGSRIFRRGLLQKQLSLNTVFQQWLNSWSQIFDGEMYTGLAFVTFRHRFHFYRMRRLTIDHAPREQAWKSRQMDKTEKSSRGESDMEKRSWLAQNEWQKHYNTWQDAKCLAIIPATGSANQFQACESFGYHRNAVRGSNFQVSSQSKHLINTCTAQTCHSNGHKTIRHT